MSSGKPKQKTQKKEIKPKKYYNPKTLIIKDGVVYTMEEYYGRETTVTNGSSKESPTTNPTTNN